MKKKPSYEKPTTIIGEDTIVEGSQLKAKTSLQINGTYIGNIQVEASVVIGEKGKVQGNIQSDFILIAGRLEGNLESNYQVHITSTGKVYGDIHCASIIIDDGALLDGTCKMKENKQQTSVKEEKDKKNLQK